VYCSVLCTLQYNTMYTIQCTQYNVHNTMNTIQCIQCYYNIVLHCLVLYTMYRFKSRGKTKQMRAIRMFISDPLILYFPMQYNVVMYFPCILLYYNTMHYIVHNTMYTIQCTQCTQYNTMYKIQYNVHNTIHAMLL